MQHDNPSIAVVVKPDGPYVVTGGVPLGVQTITPNAEGGSWSWTPGRSFEVGAAYALCRCGKSEKKPFCDGTHAKVGFDGTETASREPFARQAKTVPGATMDLHDAEPLCAFARFCDNDGGIWTLVASSDRADVSPVVEREGTFCPSGRLVLRDKRTAAEIEPDLGPASIALVEDPGKESSGPLWLRGGISVVAADGTPYETRNRQTLCRCGASANKPFCDGSHVDVAFRDGLTESEPAQS